MDAIPFHLPHFTEADLEAANEVMRSRFTTMGAQVAEFEGAFAKKHGRAFAVMTNSCTNGHMLVLRYLLDQGLVGPGTPAIFPATTFAGPSFQAAHAGYRVEFADTTPESGATDVATLMAMAPKGPAILGPLGYGGIPLEDMPALLDHAARQGQYVIEDCAHATGARYSDGTPVGGLPSFASIFSFYPTKVLNATEGGMILTDDEGLANWCRAARLHGVDKPVGDRYRSLKTDWAYVLPIMGHKCNPTNIQAAIGLSQLARLDKTLARLADVSTQYRAAADRAGLRYLQGQASGNQHLFVLRRTPRAALMEHFKDHGIQCSVHYPPLWKMPAWGDQTWDLPGAERFGDGCLSIPIYADLSEDQVARVCAAMVAFEG